MKEFSWQNIRSVYCAGIGGIGLSALARLLRADGFLVQGSERTPTDLSRQLEHEGIIIAYQQDGSALPGSIDLFIYSDALRPDHPERVAAQRRGIAAFSYFEALGKYMQQFPRSIAVAGTHGKTTTTAMIAQMMIAAGKNPTAVVGSIVPTWNANAIAGGKEMIIVEACEHQAHMLHLQPTVAVITNIDADHLDFYRDLDHIVATFQQYIDQLPPNATIITNADDPVSARLRITRTHHTFGIAASAEARAVDIREDSHAQHFSVDGMRCTLAIPGRFNIFNALASIVVGKIFDIPVSIMQESIQNYRGVWRRFEQVGVVNGIPVISDYGHHPTEIRATIAAMRTRFADRRCVVVFQPHQRARTRALFDLFVAAFDEADIVIVQEIYDVPGRERDEEKISSEQLVVALCDRGRTAFFTPTMAATEKQLAQTLTRKDTLLIMGAGDIYLLAEQWKKRHGQE